MFKSIPEKLKAFFKARDPAYIVSLLLMTFIATHSVPEPNAPIIKVDNPNFFQCAADAWCWYVARKEIGWEEVAEYVGADAAKPAPTENVATGSN
jgi:hypothetical protein